MNCSLHPMQKICLSVSAKRQPITWHLFNLLPPAVSHFRDHQNTQWLDLHRFPKVTSTAADWSHWTVSIQKKSTYYQPTELSFRFKNNLGDGSNSVRNVDTTHSKKTLVFICLRVTICYWYFVVSKQAAKSSGVEHAVYKKKHFENIKCLLTL